MSMPSFPPDGANLTREEALTMIIASIAMEELALSHILNAEGEKLQYILGTLPGAKPCAGPQEVLAVNRSVTALLEAVTQNQLLLKTSWSGRWMPVLLRLRPVRRPASRIAGLRMVRFAGRTPPHRPANLRSAKKAPFGWPPSERG